MDPRPLLALVLLLLGACALTPARRVPSTLPLLAYARTRTFTYMPHSRECQTDILRSETKIATLTAGALLPADRLHARPLRRRVFLERLARLHGEIGSDDSALGLQILSLVQYVKATRLATVPGEFQLDLGIQSASGTGPHGSSGRPCANRLPREPATPITGMPCA